MKGQSSRLTITRIAPGDQKVALEYKYSRIDQNDVMIQAIGRDPIRNKNILYDKVIIKDKVIEISNLENGIDHRVKLIAYDKNTGNEVAASDERIFRTGFVPGTAINYIHPEDYAYNSSGRSTGSPSLVKLSNGNLLASHNIFWENGGQNLTKVFQSQDGGKSWSYQSDVFPCTWGKLFMHKDLLYMLGVSTAFGELLLFESKDLGKSWSEPVIIIEGGSKEKGGPHKAPMPVVSYNGRLWTAVDYGSWKIGGFASGVVSASIEKDIMEPSNWVVTPFLPYNAEWEGTIEGGNPTLLEGNVVITKEGQLVNFLRYHTTGGEPEYGKAIMLNIDKENPEADLAFGQVVDFQGNMSKFTIHYDNISQRYYSLVNRVTTGWISQRNILTLISSEDLIEWRLERDLLNYQDNGWSEDYHKVGLQYADWVFDGEDIIAAVRTSINGAYSFHNANHLTFHRFKNIRGKDWNS